MADVKTEPKPEAAATTTETASDSTPQHVEEAAPQVWTVKALVESVMENKPKRTKVSTVIIGLLAYVGKGGLVEVMTACQKMVDKEAATEAEKATGTNG